MMLLDGVGILPDKLRKIFIITERDEFKVNDDKNKELKLVSTGVSKYMLYGKKCCLHS